MATYTVVLTSEPTGTVDGDAFAQFSGDTDVTVSGALTFTPGDWSTPQTVTVGAGQDGDAVDDTAVIGHTVSGADYGGVTAAPVDVTVDDDETASSGVTLTVSPESVSEGAGATTVTVTARLNGGTRSDPTPVAVTVGSGTAISGTDFGAVSAFTISIPANAPSHTGTFSLSPTQDTLDEPDETLSVNGSVTGLTVTPAGVEITDDDASPTVTLSLSDASIGEDAGGCDGDGEPEPRVQRGNDGDGLGVAGCAGNHLGLLPERKQGTDDRGNPDGRHGRGDDYRRRQRRGCRGQDACRCKARRVPTALGAYRVPRTWS